MSVLLLLFAAVSVVVVVVVAAAAVSFDGAVSVACLRPNVAAPVITVVSSLPAIHVDL